MASFHCSVKSGKTGSGGAHAEYIEREEKYESKKDIDLEEVITGNLPEWAESSIDFFRAADENERVNGNTYREFEIALPREFTKAQRAELVREFIAQEIGDKHAYTAAIHNPKAAIEGGEQPHAHIMFSERTIDGIDRPREQYFKRYNPKNPEKGGCQKANSGRSREQTKADMTALRERFAALQNKHLERHGYKDRVTHLSLKAQGIDREPEEHQGAYRARTLRGEIRQTRAQQTEKQPEVAQAKPSLERVPEPERPKLDLQAILAASLARHGQRESQAAAEKRAAEARQEAQRVLEAQRAREEQARQEQARQEAYKARVAAEQERRRLEPKQDEPKHSGPSR